jgi:probable rRNA maturation factor
MIEINNQTKDKINKALIKKTLQRALKFLRKRLNLSIAIVGPKEIRRLNKKCRKVDKVTDVLAFSNFIQGPEKQLIKKLKTKLNLAMIDGEIIICYQQAKKQAKKLGHSINQEIKILLIHGLLHILGYDHRTEREGKKMDELTKKLLMHS